ncbi:Bifunctional inhibitor/plant lipid transfer protein/seed storage helical domain [Dillenia turbinata]|uniref:Bifunctional inhibitor/plant lipid transfer protein/seed storage helical domain n=1 Tax=Dillenia turbinata TaxID=194707 RepID=A0AAN8VGA1_9MAGN
MGMVNFQFLILAIFTLAGILISIPKTVYGEDCTGDMEGLVKQCATYVQKTGPKEKPSPACCTVVKKVNVSCVCKSVTKAVEEAVSMAKVVYVAQCCGRPLSHGMKCGSYTVPSIAAGANHLQP